MPNALADALFADLRNAFPPQRAYPAEAFEPASMPPLVAHFLTTRLHQRLRDEAERAAPPASPWFDAGHEAVVRAWQKFADVLEQHGHYPQTVWEDALREAVEQVTAFLVRPVGTLVALIFPEGVAERPASEVMQHLNAFAAYGYLREGVRMHLQKEHLREIDATRFEALLRRIDAQVTRDYDAEAWLKLLTPLHEFAHRALPTTAGVPVWVLRAFFRDKEADAIVRRLDAVQEQRGVAALDEAGLRTLLAPPAPPAPLAEPAPSTETEALESEEVAASDTGSEAPEPPAPTGPVPLWKQFQQTQPPAPSPSRPAETPAPQTTKTAVPRWKQFRAYTIPATEPSAERTAAPVVAQTLAAPASLERAVLGEAAAERARFLDELFLNDPAYYQAVLHRLNEAPDWRAASQIIAEDVFQKNEVDIYSDTAVRFTDAVQARFA